MSDKPLPYQADFEEELCSWLNGEELDGHRVAETQTTPKKLSKPSPTATVNFPREL